MSPIEVAQRYFDAWNRHDPAAVVALFAPGGTYADPATGPPLTGEAIAAYAGGLFTAFPDLSFEIVTAAPAGDHTVAAQWMMRGANTGSLAGNPPTGRAVALPGADFIVVEGDTIRSVRGYFDQKALAEQLGLQVITQPVAVGPVAFGTAVYLQTGKPVKPGAINLTALQVRSDEEVAIVGDYSERILAELGEMPGFLSLVAAVIGHRLFTISAWEDAESPRALLRGGAHKEAMGKFFGPDLAQGGQTSVWAPHRLNRMWVRCPACGRMADADRPDGKCPCGDTLPPPPPYW